MHHAVLPAEEGPQRLEVVAQQVGHPHPLDRRPVGAGLPHVDQGQVVALPERREQQAGDVPRRAGYQDLPLCHRPIPFPSPCGLPTDSRIPPRHTPGPRNRLRASARDIPLPCPGRTSL